MENKEGEKEQEAQEEDDGNKDDEGDKEVRGRLGGSQVIDNLLVISFYIALYIKYN